MRNNWIGIAQDLSSDDVLGESYANSPFIPAPKGWTVTRKVDPGDFDSTPPWKRRGRRILGGIVLVLIVLGWRPEPQGESKPALLAKESVALPSPETARNAGFSSPAAPAPLADSGIAAAAPDHERKPQNADQSKATARPTSLTQGSDRSSGSNRTEELAKRSTPARPVAPRTASAASAALPPPTRDSEIDLNKFRELTGRL